MKISFDPKKDGGRSEILQNWEQRRTEPDPIARTLIDLIFDDPEGMRVRLNKRRAA